jgi:hypothetical protein
LAGNRSIANHVFFENTTTIEKSDYMITSDANQMTLKIVATGTFQIKITADISPKSIDNFKPYPCYQLPNLTSITDVITDANYLYSIDLTSIDYIRVEILSLTGSLSCYAKVVG